MACFQKMSNIPIITSTERERTRLSQTNSYHTAHALDQQPASHASTTQPVQEQNTKLAGKVLGCRRAGIIAKAYYRSTFDCLPYI